MGHGVLQFSQCVNLPGPFCPRCSPIAYPEHALSIFLTDMAQKTSDKSEVVE